MYVDNEPAMKGNGAVLNDLLDELYAIELMTKSQIIINTH